jgi:hypothetical protein
MEHETTAPVTNSIRKGAVAGDAFHRKLQELRAEFESGQRQIAMLDQTRSELRDTLLQIRGAMRVLEELLPQPKDDDACDVFQPGDASSGPNRSFG